MKFSGFFSGIEEEVWMKWSLKFSGFLLRPASVCVSSSLYYLPYCEDILWHFFFFVYSMLREVFEVLKYVKSSMKFLGWRFLRLVWMEVWSCNFIELSQQNVSSFCFHFADFTSCIYFFLLKDKFHQVFENELYTTT